MSLRYAMYETPVPDNREDKGRKHARVVYNSTVSMEMICKLVSASSSFSSADVKGILASFTHWMGVYLAEGSLIRLEGLGHFSPSLRSREVIDMQGKKRIEVEVHTVGFRCSPELKRLMRKASLEETKRICIHFPAEERLERIRILIGERHHINCNDVMTLNNCTRHVALADLKVLMAEGTVVRIGKVRQTMYVLPYK